MIEEQNTGEYVAPEINVYDIKSQGVLCTSTNGMPIDDPLNLDS